MKKADVKTGEVYSAKVSGNIVPVRIDRANPRGGWDGTNLKTKKAVRIKSAQRLRGKASTWPGKPATKSAAKPADGATKTAPAAKKKGGGITDATKADAVNAAMQAVAADKKKRASGLDAAAKVLAEAGKPMNTKEMVEQMLAKSLWKTSGKTPAATIYAAIIREIAGKGADSRFRKVERGKFELAK